MTPDEFVRARLAETETTANEALGTEAIVDRELGRSKHRWVYSRGRITDDVAQAPGPSPTLRVKHTWPQEAAHIVLNDPHHVLAWVAALRAILDEHPRRDPLYGPGCSTCDHEGDIHPRWPCATVENLAAIWSTHPDYQQEWKP